MQNEKAILCFAKKYVFVIFSKLDRFPRKKAVNQKFGGFGVALYPFIHSLHASAASHWVVMQVYGEAWRRVLLGAGSHLGLAGSLSWSRAAEG